MSVCNGCAGHRVHLIVDSWEGTRAERRRGRDAATEIACHYCGAMVALDPSRMRLRHPSVELVCPTCALVMRVRRGDAYRDPEIGIAWTFASYGGQPVERAWAKRSRAQRWAHRRRS